MIKKPYQDSPLAKFVEQRVSELQGRKTQAEIAAAAGYMSRNIIAMLKSGATKLALHRVSDLAKALECDAGLLLYRLALLQPGNEMTARAVEEIFGTLVSRNEVAWIKELRTASGNSDPMLTARSRVALRRIFGR